MSELGTQNIAQDLAKEDLGTVVSLGRTASHFIDTLVAGTAKEIIRLEADPKRAAQLKQQYDGAVKVFPAAFSDHDGPATLYHFSIDAFAALRPASGLLQLFPGLRETDRTRVEACSAASLLEDVRLDEDAQNVLILGAPGEELNAVEQLIELGSLTRFAHIITPLPSEPLYEGGADGAALLSQLEGHGFRIVSVDKSDPDRPIAWLRKDKALADLITECGDLRLETDTLRQSLQETESKVAAQETDLQAEREKAHALAKKIDRLREITTTLEETKKQLDAVKAENASLKKQLPDAPEIAEPVQTSSSAQIRAEFSRLEAQIGILQTLSPLKTTA